MAKYREEKDTMGRMRVPAAALYGAQTQRAVENFPISGQPMPPEFIHALGALKRDAAAVNLELGLLEAALAKAIQKAAGEVAAGKWDGFGPYKGHNPSRLAKVASFGSVCDPK